LVLASFLPSRRTATAPVLLASSEGDAAARRAAAEDVEPLPLPGPEGFRGRVLDADGAPVAGANVTLIDRQGRQAGLTTTDPWGRWALAAPEAGTYVLAASATGHAPRACPAQRGPAVTDLVLGAVSAPERRTAVPS
ncbi:carboxypeptidase-like regulatory domain-containing protein, partial [Streptomyces sp. NPDC055992]|uniref:carboxypeptidase-like regulatory domain-containing protein n=1 Tax=Streptomyces sp. NPDC055992 TaxID=3345673 RepID=UPI0035D7B706